MTSARKDDMQTDCACRVDYRPYLRIAEDGHIWWIWEDALRLGAGFLPMCDDHRQLEPELRAPNGRVLANLRMLLAALNDPRSAIDKPPSMERDGYRYVDAAQFLAWLTQYLDESQCGIAFPGALDEMVRQALASRDAFLAHSESPCKPAGASLIRWHFRVLRDEDANDRWWKERMANAKRYGLLECRVGAGKKGRSGETLWRPDLIAAWLVDRHQAGKMGMDEKAVAEALRRFEGCEDIARQFFHDCHDEAD